MLVGDNELRTTKIAGELLAILIAMQMRWFEAGPIARWSTYRASLEATGRPHWASACTVSPRWSPWSWKILEYTKTLAKHTF